MFPHIETTTPTSAAYPASFLLIQRLTQQLSFLVEVYQLANLLRLLQHIHSPYTVSETDASTQGENLSKASTIVLTCINLMSTHLLI